MGQAKSTKDFFLTPVTRAARPAIRPTLFLRFHRYIEQRPPKKDTPTEKDEKRYTHIHPCWITSIPSDFSLPSFLSVPAFSARSFPFSAAPFSPLPICQTTRYSSSFPKKRPSFPANDREPKIAFLPSRSALCVCSGMSLS